MNQGIPKNVRDALAKQTAQGPHPAADLLRYNYYILYKELPPGLATSPKLYKAIVERFRVMTPFLQFLTAAFAAPPKKSDALAMFA